jgi:hypothetical protein
VPISKAVEASAALPGYYPPVKIDGRHYVDGALLKTLHASAALKEGVKLLFAINPLVPYKAELQHPGMEIKSLAGDILEDHHGIFSMHGACVDIDGKGLCIIGAPKAGKTTQTYGLLQDLHTRIVADDWFFSRVYGPDILAYSSEKNFYIGEDLGTIWKQFGGLVPDGAYDHNGRAIADIRWVIGKGRILPMTTLKTIIVLKRDPTDTTISRTLDPDTGLKLFVENNYFNPHLFVHNPFKNRIRNRYVAELLERTTVYQVNTTGTPVETQKMIRSLVGIPQSG